MHTCIRHVLTNTSYEPIQVTIQIDTNGIEWGRMNI